MKLRRNPFQPTQEKPVQIINPEAVKGGFWLLSKGSLEGNVAPIGQQELERIDLDLSLLQFKAAENLAKEHKIPVEDAERKFYPTRLTDGTMIEAEVSTLSYLSEADKESYMKLANITRTLPLKAATKLIQFRSLFHVTVVSYQPKSDRLYIENPWYEIDPVECKFIKLQSGLLLEVTEGFDNGSIGIKPTTVEILPGEIGFIVDEHSSYLVGFPQWSEEMTLEFLSFQGSEEESHVTKLYQFYLRESGKLKDKKDDSGDTTEDTDENTTEDQSFLPEKNGSREQSSNLVLTGSTSTKKSKATE